MVQKTKTLVVPSASLVARGITVAAWDRGLFPVSPSNCFFERQNHTTRFLTAWSVLDWKGTSWIAVVVASKTLMSWQERLRIIEYMYTLHIPSMYDIFTCVWLIHMVHLGKYTLQALQGCYGFYTLYITYIKKKRWYTTMSISTT